MADPKGRERSYLEALVSWGRGLTLGPIPEQPRWFMHPEEEEETT